MSADSFVPTVICDSTGDILLYGRMNNAGPGPDQVGARITPRTKCARCGGPFLVGHYITADLAPNMAGTARHTDCDDPTLAHREWDGS